MRDVPAGVGCQSQQEHDPLERQYRPHPELVLGDAERLRQNARAGGQQNVQSCDFSYGSERGVCRRQGVVGLAKFERYLWTYMSTKLRNHRQNDHGKIEKHDQRLAPGVPPKTPQPREQRADEQPHSHCKLREQSQVGVERSHGSWEAFPSPHSSAANDVKHETPGQVIKPGQSVQINVGLALANVTVTDPHNRLVTSPRPDNFHLFEDNVEQEAQYSSSENAPYFP